MSRLIIAIIIFSLILTGSISAVIYISKNVEKLESSLAMIIETLYSDDFAKARTLSINFEKKWNKVEPFIIMLVRHNSIDEVSRHISRLTAYCINDCKADAIAEAEFVKVILKHISEDEKAKFHNFF